MVEKPKKFIHHRASARRTCMIGLRVSNCRCVVFSLIWIGEPSYTFIYIYICINPTSPLGLGGLGWGVCFQPLFFQPFWFQPSREGFWTPPPRARLGFLIATFWQSCCPSFLDHFFDAVVNASWLDFPSQLAPQSRHKSNKNRCQHAFSC